MPEKKKRKQKTIVTKTGDGGKTSLYGGKRVFKNDLCIEVLGTLDEVTSYLGLIKSLITSGSDKKVLTEIQKDLFCIGTELAAFGSASCRKQSIGSRHLDKIQAAIDHLTGKRNVRPDGFCIPGESTLSALFDVARCIVRCAERNAVALKRKKKCSHEYVLVYLNRLSDLLYLYARHYQQYRIKISLSKRR